MPEFDSTIRWCEIPGFPGYAVSDQGHVWSRHGAGGEWRPLRPTPNHYGKVTYHVVKLRVVVNGRSMPYSRKVHRLVMLAFARPCPDGQEVLHKNGDGLDSRLINLRYGTRRENMADVKAHGRDNTGERNGGTKLTEAMVRLLRSDHAAGGIGYRKLGKRYDIDRTTVRAIIKRKTWHHVV